MSITIWYHRFSINKLDKYLKYIRRPVWSEAWSAERWLTTCWRIDRGFSCCGSWLRTSSTVRRTVTISAISSRCGFHISSITWCQVRGRCWLWSSPSICRNLQKNIFNIHSTLFLSYSLNYCIWYKIVNILNKLP